MADNRRMNDCVGGGGGGFSVAWATTHKDRKAAKRRKNAAHGASRGLRLGKGEAPEGRKKIMSHTSGNILLHLIFSNYLFLLPTDRSSRLSR